MVIERNIDDFVINGSAAILDAISKITRNKARFIVCVDDAGMLQGVLSDGDFRRWVSGEADIDLSAPVSEICNRSVVSAAVNSTTSVLNELFNARISFVPLLDARGRVVAIARGDGPTELRIDQRTISADSSCFIIAEIGINHNGSLECAKRLIDCAVEAGADCAKFQMRHMSALYGNGGDANDASEDLGAQYTLEVLARAQLSPEEMEEAFDYCKERGIIPMCTPWDLPSLARLAAYGVPAYKVASADLTNHDLLRAVAATGKPLILSSGMSTEQEIVESCGVLRSVGASFALLHCNSTYPAPFKDVNLRYLDRLRKLSGSLVGYSGHERGYSVVLAAVAIGAKIIEKHITLDRGMAGNDHKVSLEPKEFVAMVRTIREVEEAMGDSSPRSISPGERMNREVLAKSLVASCDIPKGAAIQASMISVKSPGKGLQPNKRSALVGRTARRALAAGDFFFESDLSDAKIGPRPYSFKRPWGIPVRYHDWKSLYQDLPMDFLEFHFSYKDIATDPAKFFDGPLPVGLVTHSPDLFSNDHILNLAADDEEYRAISIGNLQRSVDAARSLRRWFPKAGRIPIIASLGGMSREAPLPRGDREMLYDRVADSMRQIDLDGVEILPQTLPPYPWYLGGQLYCNLFVDPEDTAAFCRKYDLRLCFDISHSKLTANARKRPFSEFIELLAPIAGHLHIVDATGVDGEGVQIGDGEVDFPELAKKLATLCPNAAFIPEIWQGHKNGGEGFWIALERLEGLL